MNLAKADISQFIACIGKLGYARAELSARNAHFPFSAFPHVRQTLPSIQRMLGTPHVSCPHVRKGILCNPSNQRKQPLALTSPTWARGRSPCAAGNPMPTWGKKPRNAEFLLFPKTLSSGCPRARARGENPIFRPALQSAQAGAIPHKWRKGRGTNSTKRVAQSASIPTWPPCGTSGHPENARATARWCFTVSRQLLGWVQVACRNYLAGNQRYSAEYRSSNGMAGESVALNPALRERNRNLKGCGLTGLLFWVGIAPATLRSKNSRQSPR